MTAKELIFEEESRERLARGMDKLCEVIKFTLGPKGRNVSLEKSWGPPTITNDGGKIIKETNLPDQYEDMGASMMREVVEKMQETCGDGSTTASLLLSTLVNCGLKHISSGTNPTLLKRGIDKAVEVVVKELEKKSLPIDSEAEICNIATISASGRADIGKIIAEAVSKAGKNGVITIEEAKATHTTIDLVEGMSFDRGWMSPYFCTNADKHEAVLENCKILLINRKVSNVHDLLPILERIATTGQQLLIIAEDIEGDALSTLVINRLRGTLKVCAVKAPGFGDRRTAQMQDLAVLTGATLISDDTGISTKDANQEMLGNAEKIIVAKDQTTIVNGKGSAEAIKSRIKQIEGEVERCTSSYDKEKLEERKAKLSGGVAVVNVGAVTEQEMKLEKAKYQDSLNSTKAALQEGVVVGGGIALLRARKAIDALKLTGDEALGAAIVRRALEEPFKTIVANSGHDAAVYLHEVESLSDNMGFNAMSEKIEDLMKAGVIDPAKVVRNALQRASSAAGIALITEVLVGKAPEPKKEKV